jgi:hypothetical protein
MRRFVIGLLLAGSIAWGQQARRKIIIDEDCSGPGGSNLQTVAMLLQARDVDVLGVTKKPSIRSDCSKLWGERKSPS